MRLDPGVLETRTETYDEISFVKHYKLKFKCPTCVGTCGLEMATEDHSRICNIAKVVDKQSQDTISGSCDKDEPCYEAAIRVQDSNRDYTNDNYVKTSINERQLAVLPILESSIVSIVVQIFP